MGIIALIIGGVIGYLLAEKVTAKNWGIKLCYALAIPVVFDIIVLCIIGATTGSSYAAGTYGAPFIIGSFMFAILVLAKMKREDKQQSSN